MLNRRGIAPIGMKSLGGRGNIVTEAGIPVEDALRYVLSLPISTLVCGIDSEKVLDQNLKIANFDIAIAEFPACDVPTRESGAVEQRFPAVPAGVLLAPRLRRGSRGGCRAGAKCQDDDRTDSGIP